MPGGLRNPWDNLPRTEEINGSVATDGARVSRRHSEGSAGPDSKRIIVSGEMADSAAGMNVSGSQDAIAKMEMGGIA
jgi:hypothetical protein